MTAHNLVFDILPPIYSVARTSDDLSLISAYRNLIFIALLYQLPHHYGDSALHQRFSRRPTNTPLAYIMTRQPRINDEYNVAMHVVLIQ
jgi:hypothetical protein